MRVSEHVATGRSSEDRSEAEIRSDQRVLDVVIVGAGFAGMYMLHRARGQGLRARVYEAGTGVGGTWYWNRYPGARCDVESVEYSYSFDEALQQEWVWTERYAGQPEILRYANHVADRFDLRPDMRFETRVEAAHYDEATARWRVTVRPSDGAAELVDTRFLIMATGCLSSTNTPDIAGIERFAGEVYHTGKWPHEGVDFAGKRVGIIGTGSSAVQAIPVIAEQAEQLLVFQRTPQYTVPAHNRPLNQAEIDEIKADYPAFRARNRMMPAAFNSRMPRNTVSAFAVTPEERAAEFAARWERGGTTFMGSFADLAIDPAANQLAAEYVRAKIAEMVADPDVAAKLQPQHTIGCKRLCIDSGYYDTFNRPNVSVIDVGSEPIERISETGLRAGGVDYQFDCLIFATGFDAMTGTLLKIDIRGRDGLPLRDKWAAGPRTYLGLGIVGFPNLFTVSGPGSPSVLTNMIISIEQHVEWIADCIAHLDATGRRSIEATEPAEEAWVDHVNAVADMTLYPTCNSWYLGANVPGKTRVFMPLLGFPPYVETCEKVAANDYEGFELRA